MVRQVHQESDSSAPHSPESTTKGSVSTIPADSVHIPTQLATIDQNAWGNDSIPKFIQMACMGIHRWIGHADWQKLTDAEKDYVIRSWETNGISYHINDQGISTLASDTAKNSPAGYLFSQGEFKFISEDCRLRHSSMIRITVVDVDSAKEARRMAREFLADVKQFGLTIH